MGIDRRESQLVGCLPPRSVAQTTSDRRRRPASFGTFRTDMHGFLGACGYFYTVKASLGGEFRDELLRFPGIEE
jgi:hypothetical protein